MFILCFGSNRNAFYLYMVTSADCSSTPCYAHAWLYKGCGYYVDLSVPCNQSTSCMWKWSPPCDVQGWPGEFFPKWNGNSENLGNLINHQGMNCLSYAAWWCCRSILVSNARGWTNILNVQSKFETNNLHWKHLGKTQTYWEHENRSNGPASLRSTSICEVHLLFTLNVLRRRQKFFLSINQAKR